MRTCKHLIILALFFGFLTGCEKYWDEHYSTQYETVDQDVWEIIKGQSDLSQFVGLVEQFHLDSIFGTNDVYTLFIPNNKAISTYLDSTAITRGDVAYHILKYFIQPNNIKGKKKIQTLLLKFAQFENRSEQYFYDGIPLAFTSPLYRNGRYFILNQVATPKPSLYEYISLNNPALKMFIDAQDSIILDKELSKPLGFDEHGNTVYDSVISVINLFEEEYFEVSTEFRLKTATLVFPGKELYQKALTNMALKLGGTYNSYEDIAVEWQQDILIPYLLNKGIFGNLREASEFEQDTLINILGDSVRIDYVPTEKTICSNGYAYNYKEFEILDSLFMSPVRNEGEHLLKILGKDRYAWKDSVVAKSDQTFLPLAEYIPTTASNDSILKVSFPKGYTGKFNLEFKTQSLFPRKYLVVVRTHMDIGGIYDIYINDQLVKTFNYYDYIRYKYVLPSSVSGKRFIPVGRYNKFDFWVENLSEYGPAKVRFEYKGTGSVPNQGLILDYIEFVPESMTHLITLNP